MKNIIRNTTALLGLALLSTPVFAQETPKPEAAKPDYRLYLIGNSLTDQIYWGKFEEMAKSGGRNIVLGSQRVPGAPIGWFVQHPDGGFQSGTFGPWKKAFAEHEWDGLSLQPFQWSYKENIRDIPVLAEEFYKKSPQGQLFIYAQWPSWGKGGDWTRRWLEPREQNIMSRAEHEDTVTWLHENLKGHKPARLVPVGQVMHLLEQKAKAGLVPGMQTMWNVYDDDVHINNVGSFIVASTFYATTQERSPEGLDFKPYAEGKMKLTPELAKVIQQTVWEVVATHRMTGVQSTLAPQIATPALDAAVHNSTYYGEIFPAFGRAPRTMKIKSGKLPAGMTLSENGILGGAPTEVGDARFEVQVTDAAGKSAARPMALKVVADSTPQIAIMKLPALKQGGYVRYELKAQSDNAPLFWKIEKGELPKGMTFNDGGILEGTPGEAGAREITFAVTDSDNQNPETATQVVNLDVAPAGKDVSFARRIDWKPDVNGKLDANEKWDFKEPVTKVLSGAPNDPAPLVDIAYDNEALYVAVLVKDKDVIGADLPGWAWKNDGKTDIVKIYIDGMNNREQIYNWDDFQFTNTPGHGRANIRGGWWADAKASPVEGGYLVEARMNWTSSGQKIEGKNPSDFLSVGVDVHVIDVDAKDGAPLSRVAWFGTEKNDTDPSGYRTVIMRP
ncbi:MAG TPA: putative Ig domain-containing protein [Abditibacteriaceae bacterium]|jgi:hypothetical protein